jgi:MSHA biogenesis protein MshL
VTLGGTAGQINLPLASSNISETDSIVRTRDGRVIVIGGLMTESATSSKSKVPGLGDVKGVGAAFRQQGASKTKSELVILLKASVVQGQENWANDMLSSKQRIEEMQRPVPTEDK